jgi:hypothetical protein
MPLQPLVTKVIRRKVKLTVVECQNRLSLQHSRTANGLHQTGPAAAKLRQHFMTQKITVETQVIVTGIGNEGQLPRLHIGVD